MRFSPSFNGAQSFLALVQPVVNAAGEKTTVSMNTAQTWSDPDLVSLTQSAVPKKLSLDFNGAQALIPTLQQVISTAGVDTTISVNTAQVLDVNDLVGLMQVAAGKRLDLSYNGAQSFLGVVLPVVNAATGNSSINMNTAQTWSDSDLVSLTQAAVAKRLSLDFNSAQVLIPTLQQIISAAGADSAIGMNTAQVLAVNDLVGLMQLAGTKRLLLSFNGDQSHLDMLQPVVVAIGPNSSVSMNTAQVWSAQDLVALVQAAGGNTLIIEFNGAQSNLALVQPVVAAAGANITISVKSAQVWPQGELVALCQTADDKKLSLDFNGAQSVLSDIQAVAVSAGAETTISVNTAQVVSTNDLITLAQIAG